MALPTTRRGEVRDGTADLRTRHVCDASARMRVAFRLLSVTSMRDHISPLHEHHGFTLIEVLVVIVIVGVLAGISISQYASFRARAFDSKVAAAVRGVATSEEAFYAENRVYAASVNTLRNMAPGDVNIAISPGNTGNLNSSFRIVGTHPGATRTYTWVSDPIPGEPNLLEN
jgi:type IV pilus assembly protein PilA